MIELILARRGESQGLRAKLDHNDRVTLNASAAAAAA